MTPQPDDTNNVSEHIVKVPLHINLPRVNEDGTTRQLYVEITIKRVGLHRTWMHAEWDENDPIVDPLHTIPPGITIFMPKNTLALPIFVAVSQINDWHLPRTFIAIVRITEWLPGVAGCLDLQMSAIKAYTAASSTQSTTYTEYHDSYENADTLLQLLGLSVYADHGSTTAITQSDM